jgi:hypothetical protein
LIVALYGCEKWFLTLKNNNNWGIGVENKLLRRIFEPKREDVDGFQRKVHNEEPHNLYPSTYMITIIK